MRLEMLLESPTHGPQYVRAGGICGNRPDPMMLGAAGPYQGGVLHFGAVSGDTTALDLRVGDEIYAVELHPTDDGELQVFAVPAVGGTAASMASVEVARLVRTD